MGILMNSSGRCVWPRLTSLTCLVVLSACGSSNNEAPSSPAINTSNYVKLLQHVFDIYSGNAYFPALATLPDWSDPAYSGLPSGDPSLRTEANITCLNGGTARIVPSYTVMPPLSWTFEFSDCQDDSAVLDGQLFREYRWTHGGSGAYVVSSGLSIDSQERTLAYSGAAEEGAGGYTLGRNATGVDFRLSYASTSLELSGVNTSIGINAFTGMRLSGGFSVRSDVTGDMSIQAVVLEEIQSTTASRDSTSPWLLDGGRLELTAADGSGLLFTVDNGDPDSVTIEIIAPDGVIATLVESSSFWSGNLQFEFVFQNAWPTD